jgi:hypothetical protein
MFREVARENRRLSAEECVRILSEEKRGVLSVIGDGGYPYGMPMNHFYNPDDGKLFFHCGKDGHRTDSIRKDGRASFCVYDSGFRREGEWALNIKSAIVFGRIEEIADKETIYDISRRLSHKFTDDEKHIEEEIKRAGPRTMMFALVPEHITGKIVNES